jgi:hypothetical protein
MPLMHLNRWRGQVLFATTEDGTGMFGVRLNDNNVAPVTCTQQYRRVPATMQWHTDFD